MGLAFEAVFSASPNAYMVVDRELRYVAANPAYLNATHTRLEELIGRRVTDVFPHDPEDPSNESANRLRLSIERVFETGQPDVLAVIPYRIQVGSGAERHFEELLWSTTHTPIFDASGNVEFVLGNAVNITELAEHRPSLAPRGTAAVAAAVLGHAEQVQRENLQLDQNLRELRQIFEQAPSFLCFLRGPELVVEFANAAYTRLVGERDTIGKRVADALPEIRRQGYEELLRSVLESKRAFVGRAMRVELLNTPGGPPDEVFVDLVLQPVLGPDDRAIGVIAYGSDITQQSRAEQALRRSEERLRRVIESSGVGAWELEFPSEQFDVDERTLELFGLPPKVRPTVNDVLARIFPEDLPNVRAAMDRALRREQDGKFAEEFRLRSSNGPPRWIESRGRVTFDEAGRPKRFVGTNQDVTERKSSELEILRLARVLDESRDFIGITDLDEKPIFINAAGLGMVGLERREALEKTHMRDYFVERQRGRVLNDVVATALRDGFWEGELAFRHFKTGEEIPVLFSVFALPDPFGKVSALATITRDLRGQKALDRERHDLLRKEKAARAQAEDASRLKDEFLATVSHELRTPLTAMLGWIHLLKSSALTPEKATHALGVIERNAHAQAQLIDDLLDVSRIMSGKLVLDRHLIDLADVVMTAIETIRPAANSKGISLEVSLKGHGSVLGDAQRLQQVVWNLLSNALKFTPRGGKVSVTLESRPEWLDLTVSDTGTGIGPEFMPYLFERFRQADGGPARRLGGLGLGLSIVRNLVLAHGGEVTASSEGVDQGASFTVTLPKATEAESAARTHRRPLDATELAELAELEPSAELKDLRVLLVDDEPDTREFVATMLERLGAVVTEEDSAKAALQALKEKKFDVLVSDIGMPEEDGYSLIRKVRTLPAEEGGRTPAVALTAYARVEDRTRALKAGFQNHVAKPVRPDELVAVLDSIAHAF